MNRKFIFAAAILAGVYSAPASAQVVIDMSLITCEDFAKRPPEIKGMIASWMGGYFSASQKPEHASVRLPQAQHGKGRRLLQKA